MAPLHAFVALLLLHETVAVILPSGVPWYNAEDDRTEVCMKHIVQGLVTTTIQRMRIGLDFPVQTEGFVVSAGPPPATPKETAVNYAYCKVNGFWYWNDDACQERGRKCEQVHYDRLELELSDNTLYSSVIAAQGYYEGEYENSWIVVPTAKKLQGTTVKDIGEDFRKRYSQDSVLWFGPKSDEVRSIGLVFGGGTNGHLNDDEDDPNFKQGQTWMDLATITKYASQEAIPKSKQFAFTQVGNDFYAGELEAKTEYASEDAQCMDNK